MNIKERIRLIIDHICNADIGEYEILASLRAIVGDIEAGEQMPTAEIIKLIQDDEFEAEVNRESCNTLGAYRAELLRRINEKNTKRQ